MKQGEQLGFAGRYKKLDPVFTRKLQFPAYGARRYGIELVHRLDQRTIGYCRRFFRLQHFDLYFAFFSL